MSRSPLILCIKPQACPQQPFLILQQDGVLVRGHEVIPGARRTLEFLSGDNPFAAHFPFILLTNGGGDLEATKCKKLSDLLEFPIDESRLIQSHTVLKPLANRYWDKNVLVLGGKRDTGRRIAESYGFRNVFIPMDFFAWNPSIWPLGAEFVNDDDLALTKKCNFDHTPIAAIFVLHDPRPSWFLEIQVLTDVLRNQYCSDQPAPELVFTNPDLVWRGHFHRVRLGQGAFRDAFQAVYRSLEGGEYPYKQYGKPTKETYDYAKSMLAGLVKSSHGQPEDTQYYMIGDNPESDIAGANGAGWNSILVDTGVYDRAKGPPTHAPTYFAPDVQAAIRLAFDQEVLQTQ
ncbi:HAD hydrolase [Auriculariales sp. MPI-PUGE-AT-0066]|nr:HAD hydrolase [Auriculariales sp. MPI-PUGE-AT-0066]